MSKEIELKTMNRGDKIVMSFLMICFIIFMWVMNFYMMGVNDRFDKIENELHELKTKKDE